MIARLTIWVFVGFVAMYGIYSDMPAWGATNAGADFLVAAPYVPPSVFVRQDLPFYALFPPVYYSYPIRSPYGISPFAQLPYPYSGYGYAGVGSCQGAMATRVELPLPKPIKNPYVLSRNPVETPVMAQSAPKPLRIVNPFVATADRPGSPTASRPTISSASVATAGRQVVYPAAMARLAQ